MKKILILGAGGFIGNHLANKLKKDNYWIRGVDLKYPEFSKSVCDEFVIADLRENKLVKDLFDTKYDQVFQLAADMGGAGYIFTGDNDADVMHNSALININILKNCNITQSTNIFYSSSACIYPSFNQEDPNNPNCEELSAYPAMPDSEYGWEKLFSERLYASYSRNYNYNIRIARFHNIFGPQGTWVGGKEKAPAAVCRKVAEVKDGGNIEIWGSGMQTRSFLYIDECLDGVMRLINSNYSEPINIGSDEMISINNLAKLVSKISKKNINIINIEGPIGVMGRNSDNKLIKKILNWKPDIPLEVGLKKTYEWIKEQVDNNIQ